MESCVSATESKISYSVPEETRRIFEEGILHHPLISKDLPPEAQAYGAKIQYVGSSKPSLPINWRFAESVASLKGLEATMLNVLLTRKYGVEPQEVIINTDHASLFLMSTFLWAIDPDGENFTAVKCLATRRGAAKLHQYFPNTDYGRHQATPHRALVTNIYQTKDRRFFQLHGGMNPDPCLDMLGLPHDKETSTMEEALRPFVEKIREMESHEIQNLASDVYKQAGTICWTTQEYLDSAHGRSNAHVGLFEIHEHPNTTQHAGWWPHSPQTSLRRPLAGLKVLDITRVIAAPAITRGLAEMGASVMRVTAPHLVDYSPLHCDLNWGKWNCHLDFRKPKDREKLRKLVLQADVVVEGYRPGVLDKWGLGREGVLGICKNRERGVIYARENCYGWNGPWAYRTGWQQTSDACCGVSMEFGRAMGNDEPVYPVLPNSDYCTGIAGVSGILAALLKRAEKGGSYCVDVALNYYSKWLISTVGTYPTPVWESLYSLHNRPVFRHYHNMGYSIPRFIGLVMTNTKDELVREEFFEKREARNLGTVIQCLKPIAQFKEGTSGKVKLGYNIGTRGNGTDQPRWPEDLSVEIVS